MFGNFGNLASLLKNAPEMLRQAQEMQSRMAELREKLGKVRVQGSAGGGMVTVEATGRQSIVSMKIDPSLLEMNDPEMLEDLLVAATNQALEKAREASAEAVGELTGQMDVPGLNDMLSKLGLGGT